MNDINELTFLRRTPLFADLKTEELIRLLMTAQTITVKKHRSIYNAAEELTGVYVVKSGIVKIGGYSKNKRKEVIRDVKRTNTVFGISGLLKNGSFNEFAQTMNEPTELLLIPKAEFRSMMVNNFAFYDKTLKIIGQRLMNTEKNIECLIFEDARKRIVDFLKENIKNFGIKNGDEAWFKHCFSQTDIANMTHLSRQTVTAVLNQLRHENRLYFNRRTFLVRGYETLE